MKKLKKTLLLCLVSALMGACTYVHRRVIIALIKGEPMPVAPKWHFWCKNRETA